MANSSILDPLNYQNQSKSGGQMINASNSLEQTNSEDNQKAMMNSIQSMIKVQLEDGLNSLKQEQKEKLDRMHK